MIALYGAVCYLVFLLTFLYAVGFFADAIVPKAIDSGAQLPSGAAVTIDTLLVMLFAIQHSVMARQAFKKRWTLLVPQAAERSTYVLSSSLVLIVVFWAWQPINATIWDVGSPLGRVLLIALYAAGWLLVLASTFLISHFDLFGLRQVYLNYRSTAYADLAFKTSGLYRIVRHPLMLGFLIVFWATPRMTAGHLLFALFATTYIWIGTTLEERDLVHFLGRRYLDYRKKVPMIIPFVGKR